MPFISAGASVQDHAPERLAGEPRHVDGQAPRHDALPGQFLTVRRRVGEGALNDVEKGALTHHFPESAAISVAPTSSCATAWPLRWISPTWSKGKAAR